jgi:hypothetical protein
MGMSVVRFMLNFPLSQMPIRTTAHVFAGPIHAAALNRQQRLVHQYHVAPPNQTILRPWEQGRAFRLFPAPFQEITNP